VHEKVFAGLLFEATNLGRKVASEDCRMEPRFLDGYWLLILGRSFINDTRDYPTTVLLYQTVDIVWPQ
jgi:hypothetical protein